MMFAIFAAAVVAEADAPLPKQWAQFTRAAALSHTVETVDIATGDRNGVAEFPYRLRYTKRSLGQQIEVRWADSVSCPAIHSVIASMRDMQVPQPAPYGVPGETQSLIVDGTEYSLTVPSSDPMGKMTISSNIGSPLAQWVDGAFKALAHCWRPATP